MATAHSPLEHLHEALREASGGAATLRELPFLAQVGVRAGEPARELISRRLGVALPTQANRWQAGEPEAYWLGPDEWLLVGEPGTQAALESAARAALGEAWAAVVDLSDQRTTLELTGPAAADLLSGGCPIDLHPRAFGPSSCAQTLVARSGALIARRDGEQPTFRLFVRSSFAAYLAAWLLDAMAALEPAAAG